MATFILFPKYIYGEFISFVLVAFLSFVMFVWVTPSRAVNVDHVFEVDVNLAPEFDQDDADNIFDCFKDVFEKKFPWDFLTEPTFVAQQTGCPEIEIWYNTYEACYVNDIYDTISPIITLSLFCYAIFVL